MTNFNTYIITSTIKPTEGSYLKESDRSAFTSEVRFQQTLETIHSIRLKDPTSKIALIDNSIGKLSINQISILHHSCDVFLEYEHDLLSKFCNSSMYFHKSIPEIVLTSALIKVIKQEKLVGARIFKICGRYKLSETFDINEYSNVEYTGKYVHKTISWWKKSANNDVEWMNFFETKFYSLCNSLLDEYESLLSGILEYTIVNKTGTEVSHYTLIPIEKRITVPLLHIEGYYSTGNFIKI